MSPYLLVGFLFGAVIALCFIASFLLCFTFWNLAQSDTFFTVLKEGYTRAVMSNGKPVRFVMRSAHHRFRNQLGGIEEGHPWDIVEYTPPPEPSPPSLSSAEGLWRKLAVWVSLKIKTTGRKTRKALRFASGLYLFDDLVWVGLPPAYSVHTYSFHWTSRVQDPTSDGMVQKPREEVISHILAPQKEVYFAKIEDAKTKELVPVNASVALTIQIVNPYRALFSTHQWLKTVINQVEPDIREVIGRYTYEALTESHDSASNELKTDRDFKKRCRAIEKEYGVKIALAQFRSIEPTGKYADEITKSSLRKYSAEQEVKEAEQRVRVAEQRAKEIDILAEATERRLRKELGVVQELGPAAAAIRQMELLPKGLLVLGGNQTPVIPTLSLPQQSAPDKKGA